VGFKFVLERVSEMTIDDEKIHIDPRFASSGVFLSDFDFDMMEHHLKEDWLEEKLHC